MLDLETRPAPVYNEALGEVSEWFKEPVSKTGRPVRVSRVRIPPSPCSRPHCTPMLSSRLHA